MPKKLNRNQSNTSSAVFSDTSVNKENNSASDIIISPKSAASPDASSSFEFQLARKQKEVETARKLIETMKNNRERDEAEIRRLTEAETQLASQINTLESHLNTSNANLMAVSDKANEQIGDLRQTIDERTATIEMLKDKLGEANAALQKKKSELESNTADFKARISQLETLVSQIESETISLKQKCDSAQGELDVANKRLANEIGIKDALERECSALKQRSFESERLLGKAKIDLEDKSKQIQGLEEEVLKLKKHDSEKKREIEVGKLENDRKLRAAEAKQIQAESAVEDLSLKLKQAESSEVQLREEIEGLLHQQTLAIERISQSNSQRSAADMTSKDAIEKAREAGVRLNSVEKQLKRTEEQTEALRKELAEKSDALKVLELDSKKSIETERQKTKTVAVITSVVVLVISRLIFC